MFDVVSFGLARHMSGRPSPSKFASSLGEFGCPYGWEISLDNKKSLDSHKAHIWAI